MKKLNELQSYLTRLRGLMLTLIILCSIGSGNVWGAKITDYTNIVSGTEYYIGATTGGNDYYWSSPQTTTGDGLSGTAVTSKASATIVILEGSGTSWKIKIKGTSNYVTLSSSKANGKFNIAASSSNWTFSNASSLIKMLYTGSYCLQKNNSGTQFGSYANTQTNVWLEEAAATPTVTPDPTSLDWGTVLQGSSQSTKTISITGANLTAGTLTISATGGYSVTPTSKSVSGTLAATTLTVTPPSTSTAGSKNGKVTISGGGLASNVEVNLSMTVNAASTVTWMNNGSEYTTTLVENGSKPTFPSNPSSCDGTSTTFYGWSTSEWSGKIDDISAKTIYTSAASMPTVSGAVTYYAVFAKAAGGGSTTLLSEDFSSITTGNSTSTSGSSTSWTINSNFYSASYQYQAGGAVRLGSGSNVGYLVTKQLTAAIGDEITIAFKVKGWSSVEGNIQVSGNNSEFTQPSATTYTATMSGSFESKSVTVTLTKANPYIKIATTAKRAFIDDIVITKSGSLTYSQYLTNCCTDPGLAYGTTSMTKTFGESAFTNTLTNSHSVAVTYALSSVSPASCVSINASTGQVTINGAGSATVTASFAGNATYCADEASYTLTVNKANISPTLTYSPNSVAVGENSATPTVGGNTGSGTVTYAITSATPAGCASINTSTGVVTGLAVGSVTVTATVGATANYNGNTATATVTITAASNFPNNKTIFIQAHSTSAWTGGGCVKAWFHTAGGSEAAQTTYWLFDAGSPDEGKKLFAAIVPSTGNLPYLDIQRFAANCSDWWNKNGGCSYADADGSNAVRSTGKNDDASDGDFIRWNDDAVTLSLYGEPNSWGSSLASFSDQGNGVWTATYSNYAPANAAGESQDFKICTNYNGWIGNTGSNNNVTVSDMHVGSTYNIGASLDIKDHSLTLTKTFVKGTVHFDLQGHGSAISDLTNVTAGSKISAPSPAPTAAGYRFVGWYKEPACTNAWNFGSDVVNETMTLYAKWVQTFTVTYNSNGGSGSMTDSNSPYDSGATVTVKSNSFTAPTGKEFNHWDTKDDDTGTDYAPAATFTISANTTLYAQWSFVNYNVTYSAPSNGNYTIKVADGSATSATKTANYGQTITIAATPNSSYRFGSWTIRNTSTSADVTSTLLTGDKPTTATTTFTMPAYGVTITATFVQIHTVTWSVNGATASAASLGLASNPVVYDNGGTLALPPTDPDAPSGCSSKVFVGWTSDSEITTETSTEPSFISAGGAVTADVTYRAVFADEGAGGTKWVRKEVTSGFSLNDVSEGTWALVSSAGYAFNGTISSGHGQKTSTYVTFVNNEVAALPTGACELTFTKVMDGGNIVGYTIYSATVDQYLYASKAGSGGLAWHASESSYWKVTSDNWVYNSNTAYLRVYDNTFRTYAGSSNASLWLAKKTNEVSYDNYITVCSSCTTPSSLAMSAITSTGGKVSWSGVSLSPTEGYKVAWNTSNSVPSPLTISNSADVDADKSEYTISGLTPATQYYVFVQSKCNSTWSSSTNFYTNAKITYAANGGSGSMDPKEVTYNAASTTVDACTFTAPSGKVFNGWVSNVAVTVNGGGSPTTAVPAGATINNLTAAITLTAQWRDLNTWNITFNANNGTIAGGSPQVATEGSTFTFPNVTSTTCGTFIGWITSSSYSSATKPASFKAAGDTEDIPIGGSPAATTYYAVYAEETAPEPTDDYVLIENEQSDWSGEYLIVSEYTKDAVDYSRAFNGSLTTLDATSNYLAVTISSKTITANSTTNAIKFTIAKVVGQPGKYSVKSASNYYIGNDGASNALASSTGTIYQNTIEYDATNSRIKIKGNNASPTQLAFNSTSGQDRFRYFTTPDSQKDIQLYKKGGGSAYTYKTSPSCTPTVSTSTPASSFTYVYNAGPSASQTFQVSGSNLSTNLVVTAPSNYQVSADNSSFSSSINIAPTDGSVPTTTVYIRLSAGLNVGSYNGGVITVSSTGADNDVSGALTGSVTKAAGAIAFTDFNAVDHYEAEWTGSAVTITYNYSKTGDGTLTTTRVGGSYGTLNTEAKTWTLTNEGTYTLQLTLAAGTNYTGAGPVTANFIIYKADRYYDNIHSDVQAASSISLPIIGRGSYSAPSLVDSSPSTGNCAATHYKFMGWISQTAIDGGLPDDAAYKAALIPAGTAMTATGENYYAVWAEIEE